ncbi:unnamed protein product [Rotaria sp. Silwood2]|nr:unnamed protein product [Rotaria sp. Silwood2]CAF4522268.1 unnamed protein product [Rotaria sp. Silwood2]
MDIYPPITAYVSTMYLNRIQLDYLSRYDKLIRPLLDMYACSTTFIDAVDLIHRLETYSTNGYLKLTTYLCTFDITNLYTMLFM